MGNHVTTRLRGGGAAAGIGWVLAIVGCWSWSYSLTVLEPLARAGEIASGDAPGELVTAAHDLRWGAILVVSACVLLVLRSRGRIGAGVSVAVAVVLFVADMMLPGGSDARWPAAIAVCCLVAVLAARLWLAMDGDLPDHPCRVALGFAGVCAVFASPTLASDRTSDTGAFVSDRFWWCTGAVQLLLFLIGWVLVRAATSGLPRRWWDRAVELLAATVLVGSFVTGARADQNDLVGLLAILVVGPSSS